MIAGIKSKPYKIIIEPAVRSNKSAGKPARTSSQEYRFGFKDNGDADKSRLYKENHENNFAQNEDAITTEEVKRGKGRGMAEVKYVGSYVVVPKNSVQDSVSSDRYSIGRIVDGKLKDLYDSEKTPIIGELINLLF
jgi:hypothetical protein